MWRDYLEIARTLNHEACGVQNRDTYYPTRLPNLLKMIVIVTLRVLSIMNTQVAQFPHTQYLLVMKARGEKGAKTPSLRC